MAWWTGPAGTGASCVRTHLADLLLVVANSAWCCGACAGFLAATGSIFGGVLGTIFPMAGSTYGGGDWGSSSGGEVGELLAMSAKVAFGAPRAWRAMAAWLGHPSSAVMAAISFGIQALASMGGQLMALPGLFGGALISGLFGGLLGGGDLVTLVELLLELSISVDVASSPPMASFMAVVRVGEKKGGGITNIIQKLVTNMARLWHKMSCYWVWLHPADWSYWCLNQSNIVT